MTDSKRSFRIKDIFYLAIMILPIVAGIALKVMTQVPSDEIEITGARIFFTIPMPLQDLPISEAQINSWLVMISILGACLYLTNGLTSGVPTRRQQLAEFIVEKTQDIVNDNMGEYFKGFTPFIGAIIMLSAFSSLVSLFGLFSPTSDINIIAGWAIVVFILITYYKMKCGPVHYLKSLCEPVALLAPINVVSEFATPISMTFRHYGNILSGYVVAILVGAGLQGLSSLLLGWLPGFLGEIPFLQIGIPAVLSIYFDLFSSCLQAYIFAMLTMVYVSGGFSLDDYRERQEKKKKKLVSVN